MVKVSEEGENSAEVEEGYFASHELGVMECLQFYEMEIV